MERNREEKSRLDFFLKNSVMQLCLVLLSPVCSKLIFIYLALTHFKEFHTSLPSHCYSSHSWTFWHKSEAVKMKGFIHCKQRKPEEVPREQKGSAHALFPAHKWLCPQDSEIKHLTQNVGGGRRVFVWVSQILMDSRRGNLLPRSNSKVQRNVKAFISPVMFLPAKNRRGDLLLLGTKSPSWIINPQGEWAQEHRHIFLMFKNLESAGSFLWEHTGPVYLYLLPTTLSLQ